jgi:hypothetical protein
MWTERRKETDFIDKLSNAYVANITILMDHVVCMLLHKARAVHLKIIKVSDSKISEIGVCIKDFLLSSVSEFQDLENKRVPPPLHTAACNIGLCEDRQNILPPTSIVPALLISKHIHG